jgi:hypothetical protein
MHAQGLRASGISVSGSVWEELVDIAAESQNPFIAVAEFNRQLKDPELRRGLLTRLYIRETGRLPQSIINRLQPVFKNVD